MNAFAKLMKMRNVNQFQFMHDKSNVHPKSRLPFHIINSFNQGTNKFDDKGFFF